MNRKVSRTARKKERGAAAWSGSSHSTARSELFALALKRYHARQFPEAERICRKILASNANHADSLHLLGLILAHAGCNDEALNLFDKAVAIQGNVPTFQYNMGLLLQTMRRSTEAITHFRRAIDLQPNWTEARLTLGNACYERGALAEAELEYRQVLRLKRDSVEALYMLGNALQLQDRLEEAIVHYERALALKPNFAELRNNLGNALRRQGRLDGAVAECRRSLALKCDNPEAHNNLALALQERGMIAEAIEHYLRGLALKPDFLEGHKNLCAALMAQGCTEQALAHAQRALEIQEASDTKALFVRCLHGLADLPSISQTDHLRRLVIRALSEPWARPSELARASASLIKLDGAIGRWISRTRVLQQRLMNSLELAAVCRNEMLCCLLQSTPVSDPELEQLLTAARSVMLDMAQAATAGTRLDEDVLSFCCNLAQQCFINEYVFCYTPRELDQARDLQGSLVAALQSGSVIPELWLAAVAAYFPLHSLPAANIIASRTWSDAVARIVTQQLLEPQQEQAYRATIPRVTDIKDEMSIEVQRQYEENPYPRWVKTTSADAPTTVRRFLRDLFPMASFGHLDQVEKIQILVAGGGTGQQAVELAQRFPGAQILAVDLSLTSLCYARRKTRELGLNNVQYAQADILQMRTFDQKFNVIMATGVLHHLADPLAGWRVLASLMEPGAFMYLGIYSKLARRDVSAAQDFVSQQGYTSSSADIRRCRLQLAQLDDDLSIKNITHVSDFYYTSGCRDLLFHVQEHQMDLLEIDRFLRESDLKFLGFKIDGRILMEFRRRFPAKDALTDLKLWHIFEAENPNTFIRMYQFWIQKEQAMGNAASD